MVLRPRKRRKAIVPPLVPRNLEFIGTNNNDLIVLGNYGDAKVTAKGIFNLSGIVLCRRSTLEIDMEGMGTISLKGNCKTLIIHNISGECTLDLTDFRCCRVHCLSASGKAAILLGRTTVIERLILFNDAYVRYPGRPVLHHYSLSDNARMEQVDEAA
jgi:hypothetical protein